MMLRTPPGKQKRSSPSASPVVTKMKAVHHPAVVETMPTSSPSKKPRLPFGANAETLDEPFSLRSLRGGSSLDVGQLECYHSEHHSEELALGQCYVLPDSEIEEDNDRSLDWDNLRCSYKCRNLVKSDVLTSLDLREKEVVELKAMFYTLKGAYSSSEEEKKSLKKRAQVLEQNLAAANERENAWHKQRLQESEKTEELIRTHIARCGQLEELLQEQMRKCAEAEAKAKALEARATAAEEAKERDSEKAAREIKRYQDKLEKLHEDRMFTTSKMDAEVEIETKRVDGAKAESERLQSELDKMKNTMDKNLKKLKLEHHLLEVGIRNNAIRTTGPTEAELVIKHLKEELSQCEDEVREARKLKRFYANVDLLKERLESEKHRAERAEAALTNVADLEWKVKDLESELSAWKELMAKIPGVETRSDILLKVAELQREVVASVAKIGDANTQVVKLQTALEMAKSDKDEAEALTSAAQAELVEAALNLKRAERKVALITKERDGLKEILASYDEEEAVIASHQKKTPSATLADLGTPTRSKDLRIQQLEGALADAQQHAKLLGEELERGSSAATEERHRAETLALELGKEQERIRQVEREADQLRAEVSILEAKVGRGESNPTATKVLHMLVNPESMAHGDTEVQVLRAKLQLHERQFDCCREEDSNTNSCTDAESLAMLKQRVLALEKREVRYKQVFGNKIAVFREACGLIFGYKVQMNEEQDSSTGASITLFTLRSIYSASEDEQIQFQFKAGNLEMIANEYTASPEMQRQMLTTRSNIYRGPFQFDTGIDTRQPFLQHWLLEEFLHSFYEDEEFRKQVLRSSLSRTEMDSIIPMRIERKPRRTWLKDLERTGLFLISRDDEAEDSHSGDGKLMFISEHQTSRDAFCQCPERETLETPCLGGALWSLVYDVSVGQEDVVDAFCQCPEPAEQEDVIDAFCQYPEPGEPGCSTSPLWNELVEARAQECHPSARRWHVADCSQLGEEKGPSSPSHKGKESPFDELGDCSTDVLRCQMNTVHSVASWLLSDSVEPGSTSRSCELSCLSKGPGLMFSSNPLASLSEDKAVLFTDVFYSPNPTSSRPLTNALTEEQGTPTFLRVDEENREKEVESSGDRPRSMFCMCDSLLKRLFKMKMRIRFRLGNLGHTPGEGMPESRSDEASGANVPLPGSRVYQI